MKTKQTEIRKPDYESVSLGIRIYLNTTKDKSRNYAVIYDNDGTKHYCNEVKKVAAK